MTIGGLFGALQEFFTVLPSLTMWVAASSIYSSSGPALEKGSRVGKQSAICGSGGCNGTY